MCIKRSIPMRQAGHVLCSQLKTLQVNSVVTPIVFAGLRTLVDRYVLEESKILQVWTVKAKRKSLRKRKKRTEFTGK